MRAIHVLALLSTAAGCRSPGAPAGFAPDLADAFAAAGPDARVPVLIVGDVPADAAVFRHLPVGLLHLTEAEARALADRPGIHLAPDRPLVAAGVAGTALDADTDLVARALGADADGPDGSGVVVALLDSGVRETHGDFPKGVVVAAADFVEGHDADAKEDPYGHGTAVAGVLVGTRDGLRGVAPGVGIVSARVLGDDGVGTTSAAIAALDWIVDEAETTGVRVVNVSVGAPPRESFTLDPLAQAVEGALDAGLIVVAAAGNYGASDGEEVFGGVLSPATHPGAITVGGLDVGGTAARSDDTVAAWSSRGPTAFDGLGKPDVLAPGAALPLAARTGSTLWRDHPGARLVAYDGADLAGGKYLVASGTSFATPAVSGVVARMLQAAPELGPVQVKAILELTATGVDGDALATGAGAVNAAGAVRLASWWAEGAPEAEEPDPVDVIEGESALWGLGIIWDGYAPGTRDFGWMNGDRLAFGSLEGSGILWDGFRADDRALWYSGYAVRGSALLSPDQDAWDDDALWGTGILWDGVVAYDGSRVWTDPARWQSALVWPASLSLAGTAAPIFGEIALSGLTEPVAGAPDPTPPEPDFEAP